jgi:hypothetical protein
VECLSSRHGKNMPVNLNAYTKGKGKGKGRPRRSRILLVFTSIYKFWVLAALSVTTTELLDVTPCCLLVDYQTVWRHILVDQQFVPCHCDICAGKGKGTQSWPEWP